jgi:hypothetical protein
MKLEKKKKYILFLVKTEYVGRKMTRPVNVAKGVLDFDEVDEDFMKKLGAALKDSK